MLRAIRSTSRSRTRSSSACGPSAALEHEDVKVTTASVRAQREHKLFVSSEGAAIEQELVECGGGIDAFAARDGHHTDPQLPERARRLERTGRLGVRRVARARARGSARGRAGGRAPPRRPCPSEVTTVVHRRRADAAPGARVGRAPDGARPRLRDRGGLRRHELPQARRPRLAPVRLGAHEHHRRRDHARRARHLRLRRRGRSRAARARRRRRASSAASSPRARPRPGSAAARAARCAPTAGAGCRSSA